MTCAWCERSLRKQRSGLYATRFCAPTCRAALHRAARRYALALMEQGFLSVRQLKETPACQEKIERPRLMVAAE